MVLRTDRDLKGQDDRMWNAIVLVIELAVPSVFEELSAIFL